MIDAGTISASLILDAEPFSTSLDKALSRLSFLSIFSSEQSGSIGTLGEALAWVGGIIFPQFQQPVEKASRAVKDSCLTISESVGQTAAKVAPSGQAIKNSILTPMRETVSGGNSIMRDFGQGLINGLASKQASIIAKAKSIANSVSATMKKALGIASPSRVMRQVGRFTGEGMVQGLNDMRSDVEKASRGLAEGAVPTLSSEGAVQFSAQTFEPQAAFPEQTRTAQDSFSDVLSRKLDTLIDLLSSGRQSIELDRRTFGVLVREYT